MESVNVVKAVDDMEACGVKNLSETWETRHRLEGNQIRRPLMECSQSIAG